jgi:ABC-2 type transport system permease protein
MIRPAPVGSASHRSRAQFAALLKVQGKLAFREPSGVLAGIGLPAVLLLVFGFIGQANPGPVGDSGQSVIDVWIPTLLVIAFLGISISLPSTLVRDRELGWLRRVSTTPLHPSMLLAAQLVFNLLLAVSAVVILIGGGALLFGASLHVQILTFAISLVLAIAEIFAIGLVLAALVPSQTVGSAVSGVVFFASMFLSGLWIQPSQVGEPLRTIMYYSPTGAAARALLDSVFNGSPSYAAYLTMAVYTVIFGFIAIRYFRWE